MGAKEQLEALRMMQEGYQGAPIRQPNQELNNLARMYKETNKYSPAQMSREFGDKPLFNIPHSVYQPQNKDIINLGANMLPFIGDAQAIADAKTDYEKGNYGMAAFNAATAIPVLGDIAALAKVGIPTAAGIGGLMRQMAKRSGDVPVTPFGKQAGILGGVKAKTADLEALDKANFMELMEKPRDEIWRETGWFKSPDGQWKFEIDDSEFALNPSIRNDERYIGSIGKAVDHHKLYQGYPDTANIDYSFNQSYQQPFDELGGTYTPYVDREGQGLFDIQEEIAANRLDPKVTESTTLHELQHSVQNRERFARGGAPQDFYNPLRERKLNADSNIKTFNEMMHDNVVKRGNLEKYKYTPANKSGSIDAEIKKLSDEYQELMSKKLANIEDAQIDINEEAFNKYRALAGEAESRAVQARQSLTPQQRIDRPFWLDYDVPESEQIIKFK